MYHVYKQSKQPRHMSTVRYEHTDLTMHGYGADSDYNTKAKSVVDDNNNRVVILPDMK